eukprot:Colp12_sorted_trinity150504_noHs@1221
MAYLGCAIGIFVYQSLDAIDGKQARRTGSGSPLGELFDHGCDAVSTAFLFIGTCISLQYGAWWLPFVACLFLLSNFYCAHWQTFLTGTLEFGWVDVTEGQMLIITVHLISYFYGPSIWLTQVFGFEARIFVLVLAVCGAGSALLRNFYTILFKADGPSVAGTSAYTPAIPLFLLSFGATLAFNWSKVDTFALYPVPFVLTLGFISAKLTIKLVVAHMSKSALPLLDSLHLLPFLMAFNARYELMDEWLVLLFCFLYSLGNLTNYAIHVCSEIAACFKIKVFSIPYPPPGGVKAPVKGH